MPLPQTTHQRAAVQMLLTEGLQAQAAAQILFHQTTYFGAAAALASCIDSFAAHSFSSASNPRLVRNAVGLTFTGESISVVGPNGPGKSTLLSLVVGVTHADSGEITVNGRVAPLLEIGLGFKADLTGAENLRF